MPLPNLHEFNEAFLHAKSESQTWGNLFREINTSDYNGNKEDADDTKAYLALSGLIHVLSEWDFYSSPALDQAAAQLQVKSWQLMEFIETLRDSLAITESDLIIYENKFSKMPTQVINTGSENLEERIHNSHPAHSHVDNTIFNHSRDDHAPISSAATGPSKSVIVLSVVCLSLFVLVVIFSGLSNQRNLSSLFTSSGEPKLTSNADSNNSQAPPTPKSTNERIYFKGIELPITDKLCNNKGSFCIYGLATLANRESGEATYRFSDEADGQQVNINGIISVSKIDRNGNDRTFTFAFRDDQNNTTPGWAAAGYFNLDQDKDTSKRGILTRFITTESYGSKTPVGLENTAYLFPK